MFFDNGYWSRASANRTCSRALTELPSLAALDLDEGKGRALKAFALVPAIQAVHAILFRMQITISIRKSLLGWPTHDKANTELRKRVAHP